MDLIDRQTAIDTFHAYAPGIPWDKLDMIFAEIPSVQASGDLISRQAAIDAIENTECELLPEEWDELTDAIKALPSAQPEYEPVTAEDFAKTMSENTLYGFMAWHGEALELMERQGFVICKKTI